MTLSGAYTTAIIGLFIMRTIVKIAVGIRLEVWIGTVIYGVALIAFRIIDGFVAVLTGIFYRYKYRRTMFASQDPPVSNRDTVRFRLPGLKVILGVDTHGSLCKVDLDRYHTLICGITGSGKTRAIIAILVQLFLKPEFRSGWRVILIDLKADWDRDWLNLWAPLCYKYYSTRDLESAVSYLEELQRTMFTADDGYKYFVVIDEVARIGDASGKLKSRAHTILEAISSTLRTKGAIVASTQRPHSKIIERTITGNMDRKIVFRMDDKRSAEELGLRKSIKGLHVDVTNMVEGQFLLSEPGLRGIRMSRTMDTSEEEVLQTIAQLRTDESDWRVILFTQAASGLKEGDQIPGINKMTPLFSDLSQRNIEYAYRNYSIAKITRPRIAKMKGGETRTTGTLMAMDYDDAIVALKNYINDGNWENEPSKQAEIAQ